MVKLIAAKFGFTSAKAFFSKLGQLGARSSRFEIVAEFLQDSLYRITRIALRELRQLETRTEYGL